MAAAPVKPSDFKAVIPAANAKLCEKFLLALIKLPTLIYQLVSWAMKPDGTPTDDFKSWFGVAVGQLVPPGNVVASDGTYADKIRLTWNPVTGATYYEIFRATENSNAAAVSLGTTTNVTFDDESVTTDQVYW